VIPFYSSLFSVLAGSDALGGRRRRRIRGHLCYATTFALISRRRWLARGQETATHEGQPARGAKSMHGAGMLSQTSIFIMLVLVMQSVQPRTSRT